MRDREARPAAAPAWKSLAPAPLARTEVAAARVGRFVAEALVLDPGVVEATIGHPVELGDYLAMSWFTSSLATFGGTPGSGLEDRVEVREAADSYHPERRSDS